MSDYLNIATVILCGILQASLQLSLGALLLLHQASLGKHRKSKTRRLTRSFILGASTIVFLSLCTACFFIMRSKNGTLSLAALAAAVGLIFATSLIMLVFYYRKGRGTELWLPRNITTFIQKRAKKCNDDIEAFSLGLLSTFAELPLSLALIIVSANCISSLPDATQNWMIVLYPIMCALPMAILRLRIHDGKNIAEVQRWRIKNKNFLRFASGGGFAILALFIYAFWMV